LCSQGATDDTFGCGDIASTTVGDSVLALTDGTHDYAYAVCCDTTDGGESLSQISDASGGFQTTPVQPAYPVGDDLFLSSAVYDGTHIHVFFLAAVSLNLSEYVNNGPGGSFTGDNVINLANFSLSNFASYTPVVLGRIVHLYGVNENGDLVEIVNDNLFGNAWNAYDLTKLTGGSVPVAGLPGVLLINGVPHIYVRAAGTGDLIEYVADNLWGHIWNSYNQTTGQGASTLTGDPKPTLIGGVPHIYVDNSTNGDLIEVVADDLWGRIWNSYDQTTGQGAPSLQGDPSVIVVNGVPEVFENSNGTLQEVAADNLHGKVWSSYKINDTLVGDPTAILGESNTPQVFFFRQQEPV
jgi:hypothetical protein